MTVKDEIKSRIRVEPWSEIRGQLHNEKLLNLTYQADFLLVALALTKDDDEILRHYMSKGALRRTPENQISKWDKTPDKPFQLIIIDGYILFQELVTQKKY